MWYRLAADAVLLLHLGFIVFVLVGALPVARWPWLAAVHVPVACWGLFVEATGRVCPLTYLENALRVAAGQAGYAGGFIEHYLLAIIYPEGLTRRLQLVLAAVVIAVNAVGYGWVLHRRAAHRAGA